MLSLENTIIFLVVWYQSLKRSRLLLKKLLKEYASIASILFLSLNSDFRELSGSDHNHHHGSR